MDARAAMPGAQTETAARRLRKCDPRATNPSDLSIMKEMIAMICLEQVTVKQGTVLHSEQNIVGTIIASLCPVFPRRLEFFRVFLRLICL